MVLTSLWLSISNNPGVRVKIESANRMRHIRQIYKKETLFSSLISVVAARKLP